MKDENKENTIILNNKSYSNNNDVLSEIITKLEKVVTDLGKPKKIPISLIKLRKL